VIIDAIVSFDAVKSSTCSSPYADPFHTCTVFTPLNVRSYIVSTEVFITHGIALA